MQTSLERLWVSWLNSQRWRRFAKWGPGAVFFRSNAYKRIDLMRRRAFTTYQNWAEPTTFRDVETFCFFVGHTKSGCSLLGALLDAHPDAIVADEADALRYVICELQTGTQDIRLPVQAISPFTKDGEDERLVDLATAKPGPYLGTFLDPETGEAMDLIGQYASEGIMPARATSERFQVGSAFCNKLFNAARFAFLNLDGTTFRPLVTADLALEDRWILARLARAIRTVDEQLEAYTPSAAIGAVRDFFWNELCDWYLEMIKPRFKDGADETSKATAQQVLAAVLDQTLRLMHPFVPFLTETLWTRLRELAPERGIATAFADDPRLVHARWPQAESTWDEPATEERIAAMQQWCVAIREARARYQVAPRERIAARFRADGDAAEILRATAPLLANMAGLSETTIAADAERTPDAATVVQGPAKAFLLGVVDLEAERQKLTKEADKLKGRIQGIEKKLGNEGFVAKAPPAVVERERQNLGKLQEQLAGLEQSLAELD